MSVHHTLYLCYFWLSEPLVQTQVLPYLRELQKNGIKISLMTFEREMGKNWTSEQIVEQTRKFAAEGIDWYCLPYHKWPSAIATAYDIFRGVWFIRRMIREKKIDVLHGRIHVPTLMGAIARKFSKQKPKLLFDIRGFFPEEYTDAGNWPENGWLYRSAKRVERWLMKEADGFVVLTEKAREILFPESKVTGFDKLGRPVEVIPCCVDLNRFDVVNQSSRAKIRQKLRIEDRFVIVYVGSFGGWYLTEKTADFFGALKQKREDGFALILTQSIPELIEPLLRERGYSKTDFHITQVLPTEIPLYLSAADAALSFIKPCYSKQASSPTKNAEYLASGLPIIANPGVGDVDILIKEDGVGVLVKNFSRESYIEALSEIAELDKASDLGENCRTSAFRRFHLENVGGERYRRLYNKLLAENK